MLLNKKHCAVSRLNRHFSFLLNLINPDDTMRLIGFSKSTGATHGVPICVPVVCGAGAVVNPTCSAGLLYCVLWPPLAGEVPVSTARLEQEITVWRVRPPNAVYS